MLQSLDKIEFLVGSADMVEQMMTASAKEPFDEEVLNFLNDVSRTLMNDPRSKAYSDVITLGFWLRKGSTTKLKERYSFKDCNIHLGRGLVFHIAPSNVPVNFAYSLAAGLLTGNSNIVRVPSKDFEQVTMIAEAINAVLARHERIKSSIALVRYEREKEINDALSIICDTRIIWGGDATIEEIRKSPLLPRSTEITFADRYSLAVIDADEYLKKGNKATVALDFYNDTYFSDQNACTSPRIIVWTGNHKEEAKKIFWNELHEIIKKKYTFRAIQGVNKLTSACLAAVEIPGTKIVNRTDNLVVRVEVPEITEKLMDLKDNCGYFFEYNCDDILEIKYLCNDKRCQTIGILGDKDEIKSLLLSGMKGVDRVVEIGHTMDFDLTWDGYNLVSQLTRTITV